MRAEADPLPRQSVTDALAIVDVTPLQVCDLLGELAEGADVYLVGSLAAGLGNTKSDIDLNLFVERDTTGQQPLMLFLGERIVDVQFFPHVDARTLTAHEVIHFDGVGLVQRGPAPPVRQVKCLARWASALCIDDSGRPLLTPDQVDGLRPAITRYCLEAAVQWQWLAHTADQSGSRLSQWVWARTGRAWLDTIVHGFGESYFGPKWVWKMARRCDRLTDAQLGLFADVSDRESLGVALASVGVPQVEWERAVLVPLPLESKMSMDFGCGRQVVLAGDWIVHPDDRVMVGAAVADGGISLDQPSLDAILTDLQ